MIIAAAMLGAALVPAPALADSPFDGTWKADMSSVKMPTKPDTYQLKDGMYTCATCAPAYTVKADGSDQAVAGHPYYNTVAIKVDGNIIQETDKKDGKTVTTSTTTVASDGKTADVAFSDSSNTNAAPVTGKLTIKKVAAGPAGSGPISGSWIVSNFSNLSDNGITVTYKTDGNMLTMTMPTGQTFTAKMNGTKADYSGDPGITAVSVKKLGSRSMMETDMRNGKVVDTVKSTVSKDGKTIDVSYDDMLHYRTTTYMATKQ
jgi:hypothetical protein